MSSNCFIFKSEHFLIMYTCFVIYIKKDPYQIQKYIYFPRHVNQSSGCVLAFFRAWLNYWMLAVTVVLLWPLIWLGCNILFLCLPITISVVSVTNYFSLCLWNNWTSYSIKYTIQYPDIIMKHSDDSKIATKFTFSFM